MIEISVPKDIREFEPTLIGPLTTRKAFCAIGICAVVYGVYMLEKAMGIEDPMKAPFFLIPAIPFALVGWYKPCGMHFEKFFFRALYDNFICSTSRKMIVENFYNVFDKENDESENKKSKKDVKKYKEPRRSSLPQELRPYKERYPSIHKRSFVA